MNYHNITRDDMLNGDGLRVVLWVSGCEHHCKGCQNPITWDPQDGVFFDQKAKEELFKELEKSYISGITYLGTDKGKRSGESSGCVGRWNIYGRTAKYTASLERQFQSASDCRTGEPEN